MTVRTSLWLSGILLVMSGCAGGRQARKSPPPEWVGQRPVSSLYYIGIGSAQANPVPGEALRMAKERAAADLAGEIAVRVESASFLENEERNGLVREQFNSTISSRSDERIAGFEVVGVHEDEYGTHVYYRLDKARHAAAREARRREAIGVAEDEWAAGLTDAEAGRVTSALEHWGTGILALEEFWNDVNRADLGGENVAIESHLIRHMREAIRNLRVSPSVDHVTLSARGGFRFPLGLHATLEGTSATGVPIQYGYHNGTYRRKATEFTDEEGLVVALIERVEAQRPDRDITCTVDVKRMMDAAHLSPIVIALIGDVHSPEIRVGLDIELPSVRLVSSTRSAVSAEDHTALLDAMRGVLLDAGFDVSEHGDVDYTIEIQLRSEHRTPSSGLAQFHTAYVEGTLTLRREGGQVIEEVRLDRVKGVQLDPRAALQLALSNAAESVEKKHGRILLEGLR